MPIPSGWQVSLELFGIAEYFRQELPHGLAPANLEHVFNISNDAREKNELRRSIGVVKWQVCDRQEALGTVTFNPLDSGEASHSALHKVLEGAYASLPEKWLGERRDRASFAVGRSFRCFEERRVPSS
jgi:hypothetical protein